MIFGKILFFLYTISCFPIQFIFYLASFLNPRAKVFREIRIQAKAELKSLKISKENPIYWLHGASVGELDQAKTLARVIKQNQPKTKILITWVSDSVTEKNLKIHLLISISLYLWMDRFLIS
jgi:3-deoxy-D-manno-octulosonic-acid transferase